MHEGSKGNVQCTKEFKYYLTRWVDSAKWGGSLQSREIRFSGKMNFVGARRSLKQHCCSPFSLVCLEWTDSILDTPHWYVSTIMWYYLLMFKLQITQPPLKSSYVAKIINKASIDVYFYPLCLARAVHLLREFAIWCNLSPQQSSSNDTFLSSHLVHASWTPGLSNLN